MTVDAETDLNTGSHSSPITKKEKSREEELEELLDGLKEKFNNLPANDPLYISILTISPECWTIRKTASEFGASIRMVKKAKDLRKSEGVLAMPALKGGKSLPENTIQ